MSNRSYLYVRNPETGKKHGLSEYPWEMPISHIVLSSASPECVRSEIWENDALLAVRADFDGGRQKLLEFLHRLLNEGILSPEALKIEETQKVLDRWQGQQAKVHWEPGEILDMMDTEDLGEAMRQIYESRLLRIDDYLGEQLEQFRQWKAEGKEEDILEALGLFWDDELYYSSSSETEERGAENSGGGSGRGTVLFWIGLLVCLLAGLLYWIFG